VTLSCAVTNLPTGATNPPTCTVSQPAAISGTQAATATLTINTQSGTTAGSYTATVTGTSGALTASTTVAFTVTNPAPNAGFALSGAPIIIATQGASGTSSIAVTPSGGFTGSVALSCALTSSPTGATMPPTCTVDQTVSIAGTPAAATLTINTSAPSAAALHDPLQRIFALGGEGTIAALILFCLPFRRRKWQTLIGMLLFVIVVAAVSGCGGGGAKPVSSGGTTEGQYTVTITGTSGSIVQKIPVTVTVQ
jgi:roadblock/LC7 domain-containing protein